MSNAPVCEIQPTISNEQPSPVTFPQIAPATDIPSALNAINSMAAWMRQAQNLLNQLAKQGGISGFSTVPGKTGRWNRLQQTTKVVRVTTLAIQANMWM